jgi:hypothetical protein
MSSHGRACDLAHNPVYSVHGTVPQWDETIPRGLAVSAAWLSDWELPLSECCYVRELKCVEMMVAAKRRH